MYRLANPQLIWSQWVFFANPRYRTLAQPKIRLITKNACSTFARTLDFIRFFARSVSLNGRCLLLGINVETFRGPASETNGGRTLLDTFHQKHAVRIQTVGAATGDFAKSLLTALVRRRAPRRE
jgi:hypothetical protein